MKILINNTLLNSPQVRNAFKSNRISCFIRDRGLSFAAFIPFVLLVLFFVSCNEDDDAVAIQPWEAEVEKLRLAVEPYHELDEAIANGYNVELTDYRMGMGYHYLNESFLDGTFEIEKPEVLLFAYDGAGNLKLVGVEYATVIEDMDNPPPAPAGFTGSDDEWVINTEFNVWTLHVWTVLENPDGIFNPMNPMLP